MARWETTERPCEGMIGCGKTALAGGAMKASRGGSRKGPWPAGSCGEGIDSWEVMRVNTAGVEDKREAAGFS